MGICPEDVWEEFLQELVALELAFDLSKKTLRDRASVTEYPHGKLRFTQYVLYREPKGDDGRLVVLSRPKVQVAVWLRLDISTSAEKPLTLNVWSPQNVPDQEVQIVLCPRPQSRDPLLL